MTQINKIQAYYDKFDEWKRLETPEGILEYIITFSEITNYIPKGKRILDLGGGPGRYTIELAKIGYKMTLADLSPKLIEIAKEKAVNIRNIESIDIVNALDLSKYPLESFDCVLLLGPLYHLTENEEIEQVINNTYSVLKPNGKIIASYIPYYCGLSGIVERSGFAPKQVDSNTLKEVFESGIFHNNENSGFQEGNYMKTGKLCSIMEKNGFIKEKIRSIKGIGYRLEKVIIEKRESNIDLFNTIMDIINSSSEDEALIETSGHALYFGTKIR
jgi:ubiquinone/menaquinone biosynthesis C-methylase UbiE